jgi:hypothetical protein
MDKGHQPEERTTTYLVEHYWPGVTEADFAAAAELVLAAAESLTAEGRPVRYLHSTLVLEDEAALCVFEAGSQALVEEAYALAGVHFERIVDAVEQVVPSRREWIDDRLEENQGAKQ